MFVDSEVSIGFLIFTLISVISFTRQALKLFILFEMFIYKSSVTCCNYGSYL